MKKYYEASIVNFDENNIPYTKKMICVKSLETPTKEELEFEFEDVFNKYDGDEIRNIEEITEDEALELYEDTIVEW